jgi:hypothetical protein
MGHRFKHQADINGIPIDVARGAGNIPNSQDIDYFGFVVMMTPSAFLSLAAPVVEVRESKASLVEGLRAGAVAIAPPFLKVDFDGDGAPVVDGHEGRHRMLAIQEVAGDIEIPVHIFPRGKRARDVTEEMVAKAREGMVRENTREVVEGPLFGDACLQGRILEPDTPGFKFGS